MSVSHLSEINLTLYSQSHILPCVLLQIWRLLHVVTPPRQLLPHHQAFPPAASNNATGGANVCLSSPTPWPQPQTVTITDQTTSSLCFSCCFLIPTKLYIIYYWNEIYIYDQLLIRRWNCVCECAWVFISLCCPTLLSRKFLCYCCYCRKWHQNKLIKSSEWFFFLCNAAGGVERSPINILCYTTYKV